MTGRDRQYGLTLVELLVALAVFSLVSASSVTVLSLAIDGRDQLESASDEVRELERARSLVRADLSSLVDRPVRDAEGRQDPAFYGGEGVPLPPGRAEEGREEAVLLTLTRSGWDNPGDLRPRPELQRVAYVLRDGQLLRRTRPFLDAADGTPTQEQVLLRGLTLVEVAFYDGERWREGFASGEAGAVPPAVRLRFDHPAFGPITNDFLAGPS